jgi:SAM-dependent methyltransferase
MANDERSGMRDRFQFGKNWVKFVEENFSEEAVKASMDYFCKVTGISSLKGKTFVDIGCGSGLSSLSAYRLGAEKILSFDYDKESVDATRILWKREGGPAGWQIAQGSVLDDQFMNSLGKFDVVYAWGVLHHTGDMWKAIQNASRLINDDGFFYMAIYNKDYGTKGSEYWLKKKKFFISQPPFVQQFLFWKHIFIHQFVGSLIHFKNPCKIKKKRRGMNYFRDVLDWLGGYPYEFATAGEIFSFCRNELGLTLENMRTPAGLSNNEFVFRKYR